MRLNRLHIRTLIYIHICHVSRETLYVQLLECYAPQSAAFIGIVSGLFENRFKDGAGALTAFGSEDDVAILRPQRQRGPDEGPRGSVAGHPWP